MTDTEIQQLESLVSELYQDSRDNNNMFSEAKAQWLDSCLECPDDYNYESLWTELEEDTLYWLEGLMNDCEQDELKPGGLYHWMTVACEQAPN